MEALIADLKKFIAYDTVSTRSNERLARNVGRRLKRSGFRVVYQTRSKNGARFVNVIGRLGDGPKKPLLISAHLDTVPPGPRKHWTRTAGNPWKAVVHGAFLYGLGAADDKGPLAAILEAACAFKNRKLRRPLLVMGTFGEESGMRGALYFTRRWKGSKPCLALPAEPTDLGFTFRHKGLGVIEMELESRLRGIFKDGAECRVLRFRGRQGHSSRPRPGANALDKAVRYLESEKPEKKGLFLLRLEGGHACNLIPALAVLELGRVQTLRATSLRSTREGMPFFPIGALRDCHAVVQSALKKWNRPDPSFRPPRLTSTFAIARQSGRRLHLVFDFRLLPGQSITDIERFVRLRLRRKLARYAGIGFRMRVERDNPPLPLDLGHPLARAASDILRGSGLRPKLSAKSGCTEAGVYHRWGVPALVFGPGHSQGNIHQPNERIALQSLKGAVRFYRALIHRVCEKGEHVLRP